MEGTEQAPVAVRNDPEVLAQAFVGSLKPATRKAYEQSLKKFARWLGVPGLREVAATLCSLNAGEANLLLLRYTNSLPATLSPSAANQRLQGIRSLVKLARLAGYIAWDIQIPSRRVEPFRDTRGPGEEAVAAMLKLLEGREHAKARRDYAILRLLFDLGLRRGSVVALDLAHLDLAAGEVSVILKGRGVVRRTKVLPSTTRAALERWIEVRGTQDGPLFLRMAKSGRIAEVAEANRLSGDGIHEIVGEIGMAAGVPGKVRPHGIRHTSITKAARLMKAASLGLPALQAFSDHRSPATLGRYIDADNEGAAALAELVAREKEGME